MQKLAATTPTKRLVLSELAKIYDPEGLLGPVVFTLKCFLKRIWQLHSSWDDPLPQAEYEEWIKLSASIKELDNVQIPRHALLKSFSEIQLHVFTDASDKGYGAAVYIRSKDESGECVSHLLCAKSRIAPSERRSTARLELCGVVIGMNLLHRVAEALSLAHVKKFCWTDSAIVLHWIRKHPSQLQPFVANRVSEIQQLAKEVVVRHVSGNLNPADLISRGVHPTELVENTFWFEGPPFLIEESSEWPESMLFIEPEDHEYKSEFRRIPTITAAVQTGTDNSVIQIIESSSTLSSAKTKLIYIARFSYNINAKRLGNELRISKRMLVADYREAELTMVRAYQAIHFQTEINSLSHYDSVPRGSIIKNLDPFWDKKQRVIRVGGRLRNATHISETQRHPIILPKCHLALLIVRDSHESNMHTGHQATLANIYQQYWPLRARNLVKSVVHHCITCFRARPTMATQFM